MEDYLLDINRLLSKFNYELFEKETVALGFYDHGFSSGYISAPPLILASLSQEEVLAISVHETAHWSLTLGTEHGSLQMLFHEAAKHCDPRRASTFSKLEALMTLTSFRTQEMTATYYQLCLLEQLGGQEKRWLGYRKLANPYNKYIQEADQFLKPFELPFKLSALLLNVIAFWSMRTFITCKLENGEITSIESLLKTLTTPQYSPDKIFDALLKYFSIPEKREWICRNLWEMYGVNKKSIKEEVNKAREFKIDSRDDKILLKLLDENIDLASLNLKDTQNKQTEVIEVNLVDQLCKNDILFRVFGKDLAEPLVKAGETIKSKYGQDSHLKIPHHNAGLVIPYSKDWKRISRLEFLRKVACPKEQKGIWEWMIFISKDEYMIANEGQHLKTLSAYAISLNGPERIFSCGLNWKDVDLLNEFGKVLIFIDFSIVDLRTLQFNDIDPQQKRQGYPLMLGCSTVDVDVITDAIHIIKEKYGKIFSDRLGVFLKEGQHPLSLFAIWPGDYPRFVICFPMTEAMFIDFCEREEAKCVVDGKTMTSDFLFALKIFYTQFCIRGL